jgi:hypothetical protein
LALQLAGSSVRSVPEVGRTAFVIPPEAFRTRRPHVAILNDVVEIPIGKQGVAFDRLDLDAWAGEYRAREGCPGAIVRSDASYAASACARSPTSSKRSPRNSRGGMPGAGVTGCLYVESSRCSRR